MNFFNTAQVRPFGETAACLLASKGRLSGAADYAEIAGASIEVRRAFKSIGLLSEISALPFYRDEARVFLDTMRGFSAFDQIAALAQRVPMKRRISAMSAVIVGDGPNEGEAKAVSPFGIEDGQLALLKATALVVQSAELAGALTDTGIDFLLNQLRVALGPATDAQFFRSILAGVVPTLVTGADAEAFRFDVAAALLSLGLSATSRPVIVVDPVNALNLSFMVGADGCTAFPDMSFSGGVISGVPVFVSDGIASADAVSPMTSQIVVLDAQALAIDTGEIHLSPASDATFDLGTGPVSLWQNNLLGLRAERWVGASVARAGAVAVIDGAAYGGERNG